jgi:hypothetical protein
MDKHNRALLLLCFAGAFRRSEFVERVLRDLHFSTVGLIVTLSARQVGPGGAGTRYRHLASPVEATCRRGLSRPGSPWRDSLKGRCSGRRISVTACSRRALGQAAALI